MGILVREEATISPKAPGATKRGIAHKGDRFVLLTAIFEREAGQWHGRCLELGTATNARRLEDLQEELEDLIGLHLNALEAAGELERFLKEHNIRVYRRRPAKLLLPVPPETAQPGVFYQPHVERVALALA